MKVELNNKEINKRLESSTYREFEDLESFDEAIKQYQIDESGICFIDEDNEIVSMFKTDSVEETTVTMKKVIAVYDLGEEEITKFDKIRNIVKGFFEICFRKKITVFLLSIAFLGMAGMGVKEKYLALVFIYLWGFFRITDTSRAISFIKEMVEYYKTRDEALLDEEFMQFFNSAVTDQVVDFKLYLERKKGL